MAFVAAAGRSAQQREQLLLRGDHPEWFALISRRHRRPMNVVSNATVF